MTEWTDDHARLVADVNPVSEHESLPVERAWVRLSREMKIPRANRRSRKVVFVGIGVALAVAAGGTAAASVLSSHTGIYAKDREDRTLGGPGERLNTSGADFRAVVAQETASIPFPSAAARKDSLDFQVGDLSRDSDSFVSTSALRGFVANDAICSWSDTWARAVDERDTAQAAQAMDVLDAASHWDAVRTLQAIEADRFGWLAGVERAVHGTDLKALGSVLARHVYCLPSLVPDLPQAIPVGASTTDPPFVDPHSGSGGR
ncbi:MAG TPA: hypothetical protein VFE15_07625 [Marmoricola sp.]|jgi:hypothetical protein|nr:hypothetical protein [Marmoricola sp.]